MTEPTNNLDLCVKICSMELQGNSGHALDLLRGTINTLIDFMKTEQQHNSYQDIRLNRLEEHLEDQERKMDWLVSYLAVRLQTV
jgi:hypothetical protein